MSLVKQIVFVHLYLSLQVLCYLSFQDYLLKANPSFVSQALCYLSFQDYLLKANPSFVSSSGFQATHLAIVYNMSTPKRSQKSKKNQKHQKNLKRNREQDPDKSDSSSHKRLKEKKHKSSRSSRRKERKSLQPIPEEIEETPPPRSSPSKKHSRVISISPEHSSPPPEHVKLFPKEWDQNQSGAEPDSEDSAAGPADPATPSAKHSAAVTAAAPATPSAKRSAAVRAAAPATPSAKRSAAVTAAAPAKRSAAVTAAAPAKRSAAVTATYSAKRSAAGTAGPAAEPGRGRALQRVPRTSPEIGSSPPPPPSPVRRTVLAVRSSAPEAVVSAPQRPQFRPPCRLPIPGSTGPVEHRRSSRARAPHTPSGAHVAYASPPEAYPSAPEAYPSAPEASSPTAQARHTGNMTQANKAKMTLGLLNLPKVYTNIRNSLKAEMQNVGWVNKSVSGAAAFYGLCFHLLNLRPLRGFLPICNGGDSATRRVLADALKWLIADVGQKEKLSRGQGNREFKEAVDDSDDEDGGRPAKRSRKCKWNQVPAELDRPSIMVTVVNPDALGAFFIIVRLLHMTGTIH
ncbi:hypothetical protein DFP73DRAFT_600013 [Morchella snyderi]|nr:hypothetical protein DFP73DRAFT_600013 [Morchella snyderi]